MELKPGTVFEIPSGFDAERDEYVVDFYYYEHEVSDTNRIHILASDGRTLELEVTGIAQEYQTDGSTKPVELNVRALFHLDDRAVRSSR
ncbi:MAG: hypothetical protein IPK97_17115 [Ahniella sp.]|nr:hypothetical protein [Ahniella sp.]